MSIKDQALCTEKWLRENFNGSYLSESVPDTIAALLEALEAAEKEPEKHVADKWCADLRCNKCYSADFRFRHAAIAVQGVKT